MRTGFSSNFGFKLYVFKSFHLGNKGALGSITFLRHRSMHEKKKDLLVVEGLQEGSGGGRKKGKLCKCI